MQNRDRITAIAEKYGMTEVRIFGSVARGDEGPDSDVDFFVRRVPGSDPFLVLDFKEELAGLLGCKVDVLTEHERMRPRLMRSISRDLVTV
ncbi:MAG: nucleotidyltransferase [Verrucomicrobiaceae bacterium]|nr:MAG: nucleotidyltransferase [Verrucomicrobiaceae bacterium]